MRIGSEENDFNAGAVPTRGQISCGGSSLGSNDSRGTNNSRSVVGISRHRTCSAPVLQSLHRRRYRLMRRTVVVQFTCESDAARVVPLGATATKREHHPIPALTPGSSCRPITMLNPYFPCPV